MKKLHCSLTGIVVCAAILVSGCCRPNRYTNHVRCTSDNPSNTMKVAVFYREGTYKEVNTLCVSVLSKDEEITDLDTGNVLILKPIRYHNTFPIDSFASFDWRSDSLLSIKIAPTINVLTQHNSFKSIKITYSPLNEALKHDIDVFAIKKRYRTNTTSTVLSKIASMDYHKPDPDGFFGSYTLIDSALKRPVGELVVFNKGVPQKWQYDNREDIFVALDDYQGDMHFLVDIGIGQPKALLHEKLHDYFHYQKGSTIHADIGNYSLNCQLQNDSIASISIRYRYNK